MPFAAGKSLALETAPGMLVGPGECGIPGHRVLVIIHLELSTREWVCHTHQVTVEGPCNNPFESWKLYIQGQSFAEQEGTI